MIHPSKGTNTVRAVFIIDPDGIVRLISMVFRYRKNFKIKMIKIIFSATRLTDPLLNDLHNLVIIYPLKCLDGH